MLMRTLVSRSQTYFTNAQTLPYRKSPIYHSHAHAPHTQTHFFQWHLFVLHTRPRLWLLWLFCTHFFHPHLFHSLLMHTRTCSTNTPDSRYTRRSTMLNTWLGAAFPDTSNSACTRTSINFYHNLSLHTHNLSLSHSHTRSSRYMCVWNGIWDVYKVYEMVYVSCRRMVTIYLDSN